MRRAIAALGAVLLAVSVAAAAWAQPEGESEIFPLGHTIESALGQGIRFQFGFTVGPVADPAQVARIALTWDAGGPETTVAIDLARDFSEAAWGFNAVYDFFPADPADLPPPMAQVFYRWEVTLRDGTRAAANGEARYADDRFAWRSGASDWLTLYTYSPALNLPLLMQRLEPVYDLLREQSATAPAFQVALYEPGDGWCPPAPDPTPTPDPATPTAIPEAARTPTPAPLPACDPDAVARAYAGAGFIAVMRPNANLAWLVDELGYRMAEAAWRDAWGAATVPAWFAAGLAQLYEMSPHASALILAQNAVQTNMDYTAAALQAVLTPPEGRARDSWYAQSVSLLLYLIDQYGPDAPARVARAIPTHPTFDEALAAVTGRDTRAHLARWRLWVLSDGAAAMGAWTPYRPPTPAPTLTRTPTPSLTPRPTGTPTATLTATRFGVPAMTPIPVTPSLTSTPGPPTNTPRPPNTPTPAGGGDSGGGGGMCPGAVALLLPVGALALLRRK
ncbi:MAG: hypothetical protein Kow00120_15490 [Anaerolineae bacterium]